MAEFTLDEELTRSEIAEYFRNLADGLEQDSNLTFITGTESTTINPPDQLHFKITTKAESSWLGSGEGCSCVLELGWEQDAEPVDEELTIVNQPNDRQSVRSEERV